MAGVSGRGATVVRPCYGRRHRPYRGRIRREALEPSLARPVAAMKAAMMDGMIERGTALFGEGDVSASAKSRAHV